MLDIDVRRRRPLVVDPASSAARWTRSRATRTRPGSRPPRPGTFAGQCAELCGRNHANMTARVIGLPFDRVQGLVRPAGAAIKQAQTGAPGSARRSQAAAAGAQQRQREDSRLDGHDLRPRSHGHAAARPAPADHRRTASSPSARGWTTGSRPPITRRSGSSTSSRPLFFFLVGGVEALLMRIQLGAPDNTFLDPDDLQPALHDARHDDDLPGRRADLRRLRELPACR